MSFQRMDADTAETLAGVVRLLRRAAELVWAAADAEGVGSPRQLLGLGIDLAGDEARNLLPDWISIDGPVPVGEEPADLLRSAEQRIKRGPDSRDRGSPQQRVEIRPAIQRP